MGVGVALWRHSSPNVLQAHIQTCKLETITHAKRKRAHTATHFAHRLCLKQNVWPRLFINSTKINQTGRRPGVVLPREIVDLGVSAGPCMATRN